MPGCLESAGCLFELRGGVEAYCEGSLNSSLVEFCCTNDFSFFCKAASRYLRRPREGPQTKPSIFIMCNTALASSRVYVSCRQYNLAIIRTINVVPLEGKLPLFTVFVIVLESWRTYIPEIFLNLAADLPTNIPTDPMKAARVNSSIRGEELSVLTVRQRSGDNEHTIEYQGLLKDLGKPSSADREIYSPLKR